MVMKLRAKIVTWSVDSFRWKSHLKAIVREEMMARPKMIKLIGDEVSQALGAVKKVSRRKLWFERMKFKDSKCDEKVSSPS